MNPPKIKYNIDCKMKVLSTFIFILIFCKISFAAVTNVSTGLWSNPSVWANNHIPTSSDSVYLSYDIIVDINASCNGFNNNGHNVTINDGVAFSILNNPVDIDGNIYHTIAVCSQIWMKENLNVSHYRNGDTIPQITDPIQWSNLTTGAWCYYQNNPANGIVFGKLYNWYAVNDPRGLAPSGWHVPDVAEFDDILPNCLGGDLLAGGAMKETGTAHWLSPNTGATNSSGFTGLPGESRDLNGGFNTGTFYRNGYWWSSSEFNSSAFIRRLDYNSATTSGLYENKRMGFSVRCLRD